MLDYRVTGSVHGFSFEMTEIRLGNCRNYADAALIERYCNGRRKQAECLDIRTRLGIGAPATLWTGLVMTGLAVMIASAPEFDRRSLRRLLPAEKPTLVGLVPLLHAT